MTTSPGSALERLKQQAEAEKAAKAGAAPQASPTTPAAQPAASTPSAAPQATTPAQPTTPAATTSPATQSPAPTREVTASPMSAELAKLSDAEKVEIAANLPTTVDDADAANAALAVIFGGVSSAVSLADIASKIDNSGGNAFAWPFARLKEGNWDVPKGTDPKIYDAMPAGDRDYLAIFLGYRLAATGWKGSAPASGGGSPPVWSFAIPSLLVNRQAAQQADATLRVGNRVQFTPGDARVVFDDVGRLTPSLHVFVWKPATGFVTLVIDGYTPTNDSLEAMKSIEKNNGAPVTFLVKMAAQENKNKPEDDKRRRWDSNYIAPSLAASDNGLALMKDFLEAKQRDPVGFGKAVLGFYHATDYAGLSAPEITALLSKYEPILAKLPRGKKQTPA